MTTVALLHPGQMGVFIGASARSGAASVRWCSAGRSADTRARADAAGLAAQPSLEATLDGADIVLSVCPPDSAVALAKEVARHLSTVGSGGSPNGPIFVDCNAVSPDSAREVAAIVGAAGASFVDGGIIGPPAKVAGDTRLFLAGERAADIVPIFAGSLLDARVMAGDPGAASALKMAYAAWTKGCSALLLNVCALAEANGVANTLNEEWDLSQAGLRARSEGAAANNGFKAWRFAGEMREIAASFEAVGLPGGFHAGAAEVYERMAGFKGRDRDVTRDEVVKALLG